MTNKKQEAVDTLWVKYKKTLEMLNDALDELEKKPKEVEVIKYCNSFIFVSNILVFV